MSKQDTSPGAMHNIDSFKGLPGGNLCAIPERTALALQADGWVYRQNVPWVVRNKMPESVMSRPCKALEWVLMFTKRGSGYFFDMNSIRKPHARLWDESNAGNLSGVAGHKLHGKLSEGKQRVYPLPDPNGRSFRNADLWFESVDTPHGLTGMGDELVGLDVTTKGYSGAHFAVFPEALIRPLILASTSEKGCCGKCGAPWERVIEEGEVLRDWQEACGADVDGRYTGQTTKDYQSASVQGTLLKNPAKVKSSILKGMRERQTITWQPTCTCFGRFEKRTVKGTCRVIDTATNKRDGRIGQGLQSAKSTLVHPGDILESHEEEIEKVVQVYMPAIPLDQHPVRPCTVLDPFAGSATTSAVCLKHGRRSWGIELSQDYLDHCAIPRIERVLRSRMDLVGLSNLPAHLREEVPEAEVVDVGEDVGED